MRTITHRVGEIFLASLTAYFIAVGIITLSTYAHFFSNSPQPDVLRSFSVGISPPMTLPIAPWYAQGEKPAPLVDYVFVTLNISADFTPVWDWNTHTVYVYCSARYRTNRFVSNEVVVYDTILRSFDEAVWSAVHQQKYPLEDAEYGTLGGVPLEFVLRYQVVRFYGYSYTTEIVMNRSTATLKVPVTYSKIPERENKDTSVDTAGMDSVYSNDI